MSVTEQREANARLISDLKNARGEVMKEIKLEVKSAFRKNKIDQLIRSRVGLERLINKTSEKTAKQLARRYENVRQQIRTLGVEDIFEPTMDMNKLQVIKPEDIEDSKMEWNIEVFGVRPGTYIAMNDNFKKWVDRVFIPDHKEELLRAGRKRITRKEREAAYYWVREIIFKYGIRKRALVQRDDNGNLIRVKYLESRREWVNTE